MSKLFSFLFLLFFAFCQVSGQISQGGVPFTWEHNNVQSISKTFELPGLSFKAPASIKDIPKDGAFQFAELMSVNCGLNDAGQWEILENGDKLWRIQVKSPGAYSLNLTFDVFHLPDGAKVFLYNPDHSTLLGAFTSQNNKPSKVLSVMPIPGEELIVEYYEPATVNFPGELHIEQVGHDYLNIFGVKDNNFGRSGSCNIDINCAEGSEWQTEKHAVCRLLINNKDLCTGTLINNTQNNQIPYVLSANHCVSTQYLAEHTVFVFNYESPACGGGDGSVSESISGADLVATKNPDSGYLDFTLLKLSATVPLTYSPYFAGWDRRGIVPQNGTSIHHPMGDVKKVSKDNDALVQTSYTGYGYDPDSFWKVLQWDLGTTEGGSSGSPLFDQNHRIVGSLTGGEADCDSSVNDYFQMFSVSYEKYSADSLQLKHWLDPTNSGVGYLDGYAPKDISGDITDLISVEHYKAGDQFAFYLAGKDSAMGYVAGNNAYGDKAKAEFFNKVEFDGRNAITGGYFALGKAVGNEATQIEVFILKDDGHGYPLSTKIATTTVSMAECIAHADKDYITFTFDPPVLVSSSIYVGLTLPQNTGDTIALITLDTAQINTAWEMQYNNTWWPYSDDTHSWSISLSHILGIYIGNYTSIENNLLASIDFQVFPNPAGDYLTIEWPNENLKVNQLMVVDMFGRKIYETSPLAEDFSSVELTISMWPAGFYLVVMNTQKGITTKKLVVAH